MKDKKKEDRIQRLVGQRKRVIEKMRKEVTRRRNQDSGEEDEEQKSSRYRREADGSVEES